MLEFVAKVFRTWMNVLLWLILIVCAVGGFVAGGVLLDGWGFNFGYAVLGLIVGGLVGIITVVLSGGLIANFLKMADDIGAIKYQLSKSGNFSAGVLTPNIGEFVPTHRVKLLTDADGLSLRKKPYAYTDHFAKIPNGTEIQHINTGDTADLNGVTAPWFEIRTKDGTRGWCFSGSLEKM